MWLSRGPALDEQMDGLWALYGERIELLKESTLPPAVRAHLERALHQDMNWLVLLFPLIKMFESGRPDSDPQHWYMEREWRVLGNVQFTATDLAGIVVPESYEKRVRAELPEYAGPITTIS